MTKPCSETHINVYNDKFSMSATGAHPNWEGGGGAAGVHPPPPIEI
jgi:hypothetical protein